MFGPDLASETEEMCAAAGPEGSICNAYIKPNIGNSMYRQTSINYFHQIQQNSSRGEFAAFIPISDNSGNPSPSEYEIWSINDIGISAIFGDDDPQCPISSNQSILASIPNFSSVTIPAAVNQNLISNNDAGFINQLFAAGLPEVNVPIDVVEICPVAPEEPEVECMEATDKIFRIANRRMRKVKKAMIRYDVWQ